MEKLIRFQLPVIRLRGSPIGLSLGFHSAIPLTPNRIPLELSDDVRMIALHAPGNVSHAEVETTVVFNALALVKGENLHRDESCDLILILPPEWCRLT
jgi:hypothetical protein